MDTPGNVCIFSQKRGAKKGLEGVLLEWGKHLTGEMRRTGNSDGYAWMSVLEGNGKRMADKGFAGFYGQKKLKKSLKRGGKPIAISRYIPYNVTVVCLGMKR